MEKEIGEIDFAKSGGIVPVIVQDAALTDFIPPISAYCTKIAVMPWHLRLPDADQNKNWIWLQKQV